MTEWAHAINDGLAWLFGHVCHQDPARTWHCAGVPLFACQRCLGIYAGLVAGFVVTKLWRRRHRTLTAAPLAVQAALVAVAVMFFVKLLPDTALTRTLSGLAFGVGTGFFVALPVAAGKLADAAKNARIDASAAPVAVDQ